MKAEEIKKAIITKKLEKEKPAKEAEIMGIKGFLFEVSSALMEDWRYYCNATKYDKDKQEEVPDRDVRRLANAKLVQITFRDENGQLVFEDSDVALIAGIKTRFIDPVFRDALQINGFTRDGVEAILKNLIATNGADGLYGILASLGFPCPVCSKNTPQKSSEPNGLSSTTGQQVRRPKTGGQGSQG